MKLERIQIRCFRFPTEPQRRRIAREAARGICDDRRKWRGYFELHIRVYGPRSIYS